MQGSKQSYLIEIGGVPMPDPITDEIPPDDLDPSDPSLSESGVQIRSCSLAHPGHTNERESNLWDISFTLIEYQRAIVCRSALSHGISGPHKTRYDSRRTHRLRHL